MYSKSDAKTKRLNFRASPRWFEEAEGIRNAIKTVDGEVPDESSFIRDSVGIEMSLLNKSPYVAQRATHFVVVNANGEVLYLRGESLRFNSRTRRIPASLTMKLEKRRYFTEKYTSLEAVRSSWLLNNFALWQGSEPVGEPFQSKCDPMGLSTKAVQFDWLRPAGASVFRESCFALGDYAQYAEWKEGVRASDADDRVDILVDIPTRNFEMIVLVDRGLYAGDNLFGDGFQNRIELELRNREEVSFESGFLRNRMDDNYLKYISMIYPNSVEAGRFYRESIGRVEILASKLKSRLAEISVQNPGAFSSGGVAERLRAFSLPKKYLFLRVLWTWPHIGFYLSAKWVKPERVRTEPISLQLGL